MGHVKTAAMLGLGILIGFYGPVGLQAQGQTDFAQLLTTVKQDDTLIVTTTDGIEAKGKMLEISTDRIVLQMKQGPRTITTPNILKVQKRKNGVLLGALIGAGAMVPVSMVIGEYMNNEGGSSAYAFVPIAAGLGIGAGIDAMIGSKKTLYQRSFTRRVTVSPMIDRKGGVGARLAFKF